MAQTSNMMFFARRDQIRSARREDAIVQLAWSANRSCPLPLPLNIMAAIHENTRFSLITTALYDPRLEGKDLGWNGETAWPFFNEHIDRLQNGAIGLGWETAHKTLEGEENREKFRSLCEQGVKEFDRKSEDEAVAVCRI